MINEAGFPNLLHIHKIVIIFIQLTSYCVDRIISENLPDYHLALIKEEKHWNFLQSQILILPG